MATLWQCQSNQSQIAFSVPHYRQFGSTCRAVYIRSTYTVRKFYRARIIRRYKKKKKKKEFRRAQAYVSQILITKLLRATRVSAVSNYRVINARREFDRHFRETSRAVILPRVILPPCIREAATYARVYVRGILCVMHTCMIRVRMFEETRVAV